MPQPILRLMVFAFGFLAGVFHGQIVAKNFWLSRVVSGVKRVWTTVMEIFKKVDADTVLRYVTCFQGTVKCLLPLVSSQRDTYDSVYVEKSIAD